MSETAYVGKSNREYFEELRRRKYVREGDRIVPMQCIDEEIPGQSLFNWGWDDNLVVGEKLAEGGQADIYAATLGDGRDLVVKVFKEGSVLQELEKQWPPALLKYHQWTNDLESLGLPTFIWGAMLLRDERLLDRFAFVMERCWGDLGTMIDHQMIRSHSQGPPFSRLSFASHAGNCKRYEQFAKATSANSTQGPQSRKCTCMERFTETLHGRYRVLVADFGCSVGLMGTGFWGAPEILQQLKNKVLVSELVFMEKCDVYS